MFDENVFTQLLKNVPVLNNLSDIRFSPEKMDGKTHDPAMYFDEPKSKSYFYSSESFCSISVDLADDISYVCTWWVTADNFVVSVINMYIDLEDNYSIVGGKFHSTEEEHFQNNCLNGTPLLWDTEVLIRTTCLRLKEFYNDAYIKKFVEIGNEN